MVSCPECGKEVKGPSQLKIHMRTHGDRGPLKDITATVAPESPFAQDTPADPLGGGPAVEAPPVEPKKSLRDKLFGAKDKAADDGRPKNPTGETTPRTPRARRVDPARMLGEGWEWAGRKLEQRLPGYTPAARAMQAEAGAAGPIVADLLRDTIADRPIQFIARHYEAGSGVWSLFALPMYVQAGGAEIMASGKLAPGTRRRIEECVIDIAPSMVKWAKKEQKRRQDVTIALEEMRDVLGLPDGQPVTFDHLLGFFYPMEDATIPATVSNVA